MRNTVFFLSILCVATITSCTKEDVMPNTAEGYWKLENKQYNIKFTARSSNDGFFILSALDSLPSSDTLQVYFSSIPTVSGQYIVANFSEPAAKLKADEIGIKIRVPSTGVYSSTGISDNITWLPSSKAEINVSNGKIKVEIPKMTTIIATPTYLDTVFLEGVVIEK